MGKTKLLILSISATVAACLALSANAGVVFEGPISSSDERFNLQNDATDSAGGVEVDTTDDDNEWHEFLVSNPDKLKLGGGKTYKLSFDYVVKKVKVDDTRFYQLFRSGDDFSKDKGMGLWPGKAGEKGHKEFTVVLKDADYRLIIGVRFGGAIRIENLKIEDMTPAPLPAGVMIGSPLVPCDSFTLQANATVNNGGINVDTTGSGNEWNEYFHSSNDNLPFASGRSYKVSYDYVVSKADANAQLYHLFRIAGGEIAKDQGWEAWEAKAGDKGHKEFVAALNDPGYVFILGTRFGASVRIENLKIEDLSKKK